ncbi:deoxyribodipyrimidine photo-lyase [Rathayibacter toxicus]|uniref:Deoxyribodipyrimidine photo-lyase n=1 Tax=Rathayibacter toxicus TaxID=145458 RepID=A0A0C5BBA4_9MICO|nr:deoxyribodipyrimidine photo-lyase [Rathayibacter toxicus]AJM78183.1 deoxyribodipyrimidine photolyase [Rathayibacter toxicus]ALS57543.1 deoxyribodipyrimidine photolyase [Rathayibacter toxicus]KKM44904.1 deoxyribodipyrimidine photolyase [Rathayibacter toxicus]PPG20787.1 deoxyribodipyrimidine photo-lyase [Rathayibacter toxicus]PPG45891.1 deoxyribodipyrimidine photo-lyase [Rathayibacter toxicus]
MSDISPALVWLRDDLRLADNPALSAAVDSGGPVAICYVLDEESDGIRPLGGAARWWLHNSLKALASDLIEHGVQLILRRGSAKAVVLQLTEELGARAVHWNRRYGQAERSLDAAVKEALRATGVTAESHQGSLLYEPWTVRSGTGGPYSVYTPFARACRTSRTSGTPRIPLPRPRSLTADQHRVASDSLADWELLPTHPDWAGGLRERWTPGERAASTRLRAFLDEQLDEYAEGRDHPAWDATSHLSPHLRWGEISPFQVWNAVQHAHRAGTHHREGHQRFLDELLWREFCYHLLFHWPNLAHANFDTRFNSFPWGHSDAEKIDAWRQGHTGYPLVDAGMRELWRTGYMHNRVRMVTASFLIKNLLVDWRVGEHWFWDTLVDADPASNAANWQWVAGSGADAAPFFRVFNPVTQSKKFDSEGDYLRANVPELARVEGSAVHEPWLLEDTLTTEAAHYPARIVDLKQTRARALDAFAVVKNTPRALTRTDDN